MINARASEQAAVVGIIDPDVTVASTVNTIWMPAKDFHNFEAIVMVGTLGSSATVDALLEQATDGAGAGAKAITDKAITQLTDGGGDSDKQAIINLRPEELDVENDFTHFRLGVTVAVATSDVGAIVMGVNPHHGPASDNGLASVDEIVA